jgi:hypothetical protein
MDAATHDLTADRLIALPDAELALRFSELAGDVFDVDEGLGDLLFLFVDELVGRFAPEAARAVVLQQFGTDDPDGLLDALEAARRRAAARALRDTFAGGDRHDQR